MFSYFKELLRNLVELKSAIRSVHFDIERMRYDIESFEKQVRLITNEKLELVPKVKAVKDGN